jgi:membrane fusion protein
MAQRKSTLLSERTTRSSQHVHRQKNLDDRIAALDIEISHSAQEHSLTLQRVALAQKSLLRFQQMALEGFVSNVQAQTKQEELIDLQARLENQLRNTSTLQRELQSNQAERLNLDPQLRIELGQIDRAMASLQQESVENESRKSSRILAPHAGALSTLHVLEGATLHAGQTIASLLPQSQSLLAHLYAPTRTAGFIQPGQSVWMRLAAYPYQKFGLAKGTVMAVSGTPIAPQDLPHGQGTALLASAQSNEPLYRVQVQLESQQVFAYGEPYSLRPGMSLEADVVQDMRGIWEWLFEPLLAIQVKSKVGV